LCKFLLPSPAHTPVKQFKNRVGGLNWQPIVLLGKSHETTAKDAAEEREVLDACEIGKDRTAFDMKLREKLARKDPKGQLGVQVEQVTSL